MFRNRTNELEDVIRVSGHGSVWRFRQKVGNLGGRSRGGPQRFKKRQRSGGIVELPGGNRKTFRTRCVLGLFSSLESVLLVERRIGGGERLGVTFGEVADLVGSDCSDERQRTEKTED